MVQNHDPDMCLNDVNTQRVYSQGVIQTHLDFGDPQKEPPLKMAGFWVACLSGSPENGARVPPASPRSCERTGSSPWTSARSSQAGRGGAKALVSFLVVVGRFC